MHSVNAVNWLIFCGTHLPFSFFWPKKIMVVPCDKMEALKVPKAHMGVSENSGTPKSSIFNRVFHYKPSILGYPYFGNTHTAKS